MQTDHVFDTVIIGAGLAGISAARTLEKHNNDKSSRPQSYVILEAADKIGGRVQSETLKTADGSSVIINTGAQWLHSDMRNDAPQNPLLAQLRECDKTLNDSMPREFWNHAQPANYLANLQLIDKARQLIRDYRGPDMDLETFFKQHHLGTPSALITTFGEAETGVPLRDVSVEDMRELVACNRGDFSRKGMGNLVRHLAKDIIPHIQVGQKVTKICWGLPGGGVAVQTSGGAVYRAKHCVLTVSAGVLNAGDIVFDPPVPKRHQENISRLSMCNFNKVLLLFDKTFKMPVNHNTHMDVRTCDGQDIFYLARDNNQPLVTTFLGGELARLCDRDPEGAKKIAIDGLCEIWGDDVRKHIIDSRVTQWGNNPLIRGGYSRVAVGHHAVRQELAEPIGNAIFLAGEAIGAKDSQTGLNWATHMTGAVISGERAAKQILDKEKFANRSMPEQRGLSL